MSQATEHWAYSGGQNVWAACPGDTVTVKKQFGSNGGIKLFVSSVQPPPSPCVCVICYGAGEAL